MGILSRTNQHGDIDAVTYREATAAIAASDAGEPGA